MCNFPGVQSGLTLHPLIYPGLGSTLAQDVEKKKAEPRIPHFLSLNQDIVAWSQEEKCGLKYVIGEVWIKVCNLQNASNQLHPENAHLLFRSLCPY
jgi:hypothetical protein